MYIVVNNDNGEYITDTGGNDNPDSKGIYDELSRKIDKSKEKIVHIKGDSIFIEIFKILLINKKKFKVELENEDVIGIKILSL